MSDAPLRILVVPPMYGGSLPIAGYCTAALRGLGHTVCVFDAPQFHAGFSALRALQVEGARLEHLEKSFLRVVGQAVGALADSFAPDLVLALAQAPLDRMALEKLRRDNVPAVMWFVEDYKVFAYWRVFAPLYTAFAVIQREPFLSALAAAGQPNALYLPLAADPVFHAPARLTAAEREEYGADIAFVGAGYPNRRRAFRALRDKDFKIWGSDWHGEESLAAHIQRGGARISPEDCVKIYTATHVNLNLHSSVQARELVPAGDFVNPRTFELAAIGAFQLVDKRGLMPELFAEDELATFGSLEEMLRRTEWFLAHPEEREAFARRGQARVLREHTYTHRMQALLEFLQERLPDFGVRRRTGERLPADMPPLLREELAACLDAIQLPPDVPFAEVAERLRRQERPLSELECGILFLDAWRAQYR